MCRSMSLKSEKSLMVGVAGRAVLLHSNKRHSLIRVGGDDAIVIVGINRLRVFGRGIASDKIFSRVQLSRCMDIGRRWYYLEGPSPLLLCAYSDMADEIVKSKITIPTLKAIAAQVQQSAPELARISVALVQETVD
ncbi:hypothetical protein V8E51_003066 [Hyaloscypha variabilis]